MKRLLFVLVAVLVAVACFGQVDNLYIGDQTIEWDDTLEGVVPGVDSYWWEVRGWNYSVDNTMIETVPIESTVLFGEPVVMSFPIDWEALGLVRAEWQIAVRRLWTDGVEVAWTNAGYSTVPADVGIDGTFHSARPLDPGLHLTIAAPQGLTVTLIP